MFSPQSRADFASTAFDRIQARANQSSGLLLDSTSALLEGDRTSLRFSSSLTPAVDLDSGSSLDPTNDAVITIPSRIRFNQFTHFSLTDASGDTTRDTVFQGGALTLSYAIEGFGDISAVHLEVWQGDRIISTLGNWTGQLSRTGEIIDLSHLTTLTAGTYQIRAVAESAIGDAIFSTAQSLQILPWSRITGTFAAETFNYTATASTGTVFLGRGGTDTLNLVNISRTSVLSLNGLGVNEFNPGQNSTANQAIFGGTAFDTLTLADGRELYFQGIENLRFADGSLELQVRPNDPLFAQQWNLHVSDVEGAWRFTQGSDNVLLVSLDSGILTALGAPGGIVDIATNRLITDPTDDDNARDYGHGHSAISIMASRANNQTGIAGINWNSDVYVADVYGPESSVTLQRAIQDVMTYARANQQRVVFQTGIQGESWLTDGGTRSQLEQLIQANSDIALFAVAAGNGYRDVDDTSITQQDINRVQGRTPSTAIFSGGVSRLQTTHNNVLSVGALRPGTRSNQWSRSQEGVATVNGLVNATTVSLADYSNYGNSLTLVAATDSPAVDKLGNVGYFGGTSAANPNLAGIASLVWSVNPTLTAGQVRQILTETAMDLGIPGRDVTYGQGLVNADAAVRRAVAIGRNAPVANLHAGTSLLV